MPTSRLPLEIKSFLTTHFESVTQLEILFNFFTKPDLTWTADSMSRNLRSHPAATAKQMHKLANQGFINSDDKGQYIYSPNPALESLVTTCYILYQEKPVAVIACIYEKPNATLKGFADAFKLKKD